MFCTFNCSCTSQLTKCLLVRQTMRKTFFCFLCSEAFLPAPVKSHIMDLTGSTAAEAHSVLSSLTQCTLNVITPFDSEDVSF